MKALIQRVLSARVMVNGKISGEIKKGLCVFLGVGPEDDRGEAEFMLKKISNLRIFPDSNGKMNLSVKDSGGELLVVSQFTLYSDTLRGNRPSFTGAAEPLLARELYEYFLSIAAARGFPHVQSGVFGADMKVSLINDGPVTIMIKGKKE